MNKEKDEREDKYNTGMFRMVREILKKENYEDYYLGSILIKDAGNHLIRVFLFRCMKCNKIISANQFNYGRLCGACDIGGRGKPHYTIKMIKKKGGGRNERIKRKNLG